MINPLHPNISLCTLHTVLYTLPRVPTGGEENLSNNQELL